MSAGAAGLLSVALPRRPASRRAPRPPSMRSPTMDRCASAGPERSSRRAIASANLPSRREPELAPDVPSAAITTVVPPEVPAGCQQPLLSASTPLRPQSPSRRRAGETGERVAPGRGLQQGCGWSYPAHAGDRACPRCRPSRPIGESRWRSALPENAARSVRRRYRARARRL